MRISEIFRSIQGESTYTGLPCTFVRTAGCSLRCVYCDTEYALDRNAGEDMSLDSIMEQVESLGMDLVEITGGEPLEQKEIPDLCRKLLDLKATVLIETGGHCSIQPLPEKVIKILDIKTPSSKMAHKNDWSNLQWLSPQDEIKFVVCDRQDFEWAAAICREHDLFDKHTILFSPAFHQLKPIQLAEWILLEKVKARLSLQIHKYIWSPNIRGV